MNNEEYTLTLKGFKSKEQVKAFINWYEGQGESESSVWFEEWLDDVKYMNVDLSKKYTWEGNNLTAHLKMIE